MPTTLKAAVTKYLAPGGGVRHSGRVPNDTEEVEGMGRRSVDRAARAQRTRAFLDWVYERAVAEEGTNPGRTANKAREHLAHYFMGMGIGSHRVAAAVPKSRPQRDVAGRHYLTKAEINALYFATHKMERPRGWRGLIPVGRYWRCALVVFFNYGIDTGTVWKSEPGTSRSFGAISHGVGIARSGSQRAISLGMALLS